MITTMNNTIATSDSSRNKINTATRTNTFNIIGHHYSMDLLIATAVALLSTNTYSSFVVVNDAALKTDTIPPSFPFPLPPPPKKSTLSRPRRMRDRGGRTEALSDGQRRETTSRRSFGTSRTNALGDLLGPRQGLFRP